nr:hypothetical protein [Tanacetum cinerariifolium]
QWEVPSGSGNFLTSSGNALCILFPTYGSFQETKFLFCIPSVPDSGHNKSGCKNPTIVLPPKPPTKKGRPRETQVGVSSLLDEDLVDAPVDSAPVEVIAQNIQNAPIAKTAATQSIQAPDITPYVVVPNISPRPRSERIRNRNLAKKHTGIGSSNFNSLDLE